MRINRIIGALCLTTALIAPAYMLLGRATGAPPQKTGAPGDTTCADAGCHGGTPNTGGGSVAIDFGGSMQYTPGQTYTWTATITDSAARAWGFEVSTRLASNDTAGQAGRLEPGQNQRVICVDDRDRSGSCTATPPLEFLTHQLPANTNSFTFTWKAPDTNVGDVKVYVAGNGANANGQNTGDRIYTASYTLTAAGGSGASPQLRATSPVLQVWDASAEVSSGTWLEIYGTNLSATSRVWRGDEFQGNRAPTSLDGVRVNINGKPAFVSFISPNQVNVQAPDDDATGPVNVEVINSNGTSAPAAVQKAKVSPALLTTPAFNVGGKQYVVAYHSDFVTYVGPANLIAGVPFRPARPGDTIILYAVGCGTTNPATAAGEVPAAARPLALPYEVRFGQTVAQAQGFLAAQSVGLCQFNVTVPALSAGETGVDLRVEA